MAAWNIEVSVDAKRDLEKLDRQVARRIERYLYDRIANLPDPRSLGGPLHGPRFGELWKYRVGDWRVLSKIQDERLVILAVEVGHRSSVYEG